MRNLLGAALAASLIAGPLPALAQETAWERVGEVGAMVMEIDPASHRATGDEHRVRARMSAADSERSMVINMMVDCGDKSFMIEGQGEIYIDGKLTEKVTPPAEVSSARPAEPDEVGSLVYTHYCKAG